MRDTAKVVIIGGGAVGASCLYHLAQAGVTDCLLIEKDELTSGSTWHAAGNIPTYANSWLGMRAGNYAWRLYSELGDKVGSPITYRHTGAFWPAHTRDRMDLFHHLSGLSHSAGFELSMLSPQEMEAMHPFYTTGDGILGGIYDPYEGDIDPSQLTQALAKGARTAGAEVARFTCVTGIERTAAGEWLVKTDKGDVRCESVVNAGGFYGAKIAAMTGQSLPVATLEHQYLVTDKLPELEAHTGLFPLVRDPDVRFYLRREQNSFLFGSYGHPGRPAFTDGIPEQFAHSLFADSVDDIADLLEQAMVHVPLLGEAGAQRFVNGPIAYSPDALPLCGPAHGLPNFYHATGIQIGITHSAAVGKAITEWITGGETEWDLASWDPRRFGAWATPDYAVDRVVELYGLQYAIPYPHRILKSARPVQTTPLYQHLKQKGAVFGQIGGWERAFWFGQDDGKLSFRDGEAWQAAVRRECEGVRDHVGVMDHGGFTKYEVTGADAQAFLERVICGTVPEPGRVKLAYMLTPKGWIWSETIVARLDSDRYTLFGPTLAIDRDFDWLSSHLRDDENVTLHKGSSRDAALMLMGPKSQTLMTRLLGGDLPAAALPWLSVSELSVAGCDVTALRVSYVGETGWELHLKSADLVAVYEAIQAAGSDLGLVDFGSYALNSMRLEKGYHGWGADFGTEYTLFDAGLAHFVNWDNQHFTGRDAVLVQQGSDPEWQFAGFVIEGGDADALAGDPVYLEDKLVGYVTSAGFGFRTNKRLALAYLQFAIDTEADVFEIEILGERRKALRTAMPVYTPVVQD